MQRFQRGTNKMLREAMEVMEGNGSLRAGFSLVQIHQRQGILKPRSICMRLRNENGKKQRVNSYAATLDIAYSPLSGKNAVARSAQISPKHVCRLREVVAHTYLKYQAAACAWLAEEATKRGLAFSVSSLEFDETSHRLSVLVHHDLTPAQAARLA